MQPEPSLADPAEDDGPTIPRLPRHLVPVPDCGLIAHEDVLWDALRHHVGAVWDRAAAATAGMPLTADEPWAESDGEYGLRIGVPVPKAVPEDARSEYLDRHGERMGLPRARLTRAPDRIADLDMVELLSDTKSDEGLIVPAGTQGTVVWIYPGGRAYEVEINHENQTRNLLCTVEGEQVRLVANAKGS